MDSFQFVLIQLDFQAVRVQLHFPHSDRGIGQDTQIVDFIPVRPDDLFQLFFVLCEVENIKTFLFFKSVNLKYQIGYFDLVCGLTHSEEEGFVGAD